MRLKFVCILLIILQQGINAQNFKFGKVSEAEVKEQQHPTNPEANAAILYREYSSHFDYSQDEGFYLITDIHERIKIYNPNGFDWGTHTVDLYRESNSYKEELSGLKAYTYVLNEKGKVEEIKLRNDGIFSEKKNKFVTVEKFTMPALKEGCVIEYKYTIKTPFYSQIDPFRFQETIPVNQVSLRIDIPEYYNYKTHQRGWIPINIQSTYEERKMNFRLTQTAVETWSAVGKTTTETVTFKENIYEVSMENVPAIEPEAYSGNIKNYLSALIFELSFTNFPGKGLEMYASDWESVSKRIYASDAFGGQIAQKRYFEKEIDQVISGLTSQNEKTAAIYEFVKQKIRNNGYIGFYSDEGVKKAYEAGIGNVADINLMLISMLRYAGISANPILISTKSHGIPLFPTRNGFNYVIVGVEQDGYVTLLDASDSLGAPNILDDNLLNWQGRLIREDGSSVWVPLQSSTPSQKMIMVNYKINEEEEIEGNAKMQYTNYVALEKRKQFQSLSENEIQEKMEGKSLNINELSVENLDNPYEPLKVDYTFQASDYMENIDGKYYISPMAYMAMQENPFKLEERQYPIDYGYTQKERFIINMEVPDGYTVESLPESANMIVGDNAFNFKYLVSNQGAKIQIMVDFSVNKALVDPTQYKDVKKFYQDVIEKEKEKVVLSKL